MKSRGVLDLETIMNRKGFHPAMISHKKVRRDVHIIVTFLQIKHTTFGEVERHFGHRNVVPVKKIEIFLSIIFFKMVPLCVTNSLYICLQELRIISFSVVNMTKKLRCCQLDLGRFFYMIGKTCLQELLSILYAMQLHCIIILVKLNCFLSLYDFFEWNCYLDLMRIISSRKK